MGHYFKYFICMCPKFGTNQWKLFAMSTKPLVRGLNIGSKNYAMKTTAYKSVADIVLGWWTTIQSTLLERTHEK